MPGYPPSVHESAMPLLVSTKTTSDDPAPACPCPNVTSRLALAHWVGVLAWVTVFEAVVVSVVVAVVVAVVVTVVVLVTVVVPPSPQPVRTAAGTATAARAHAMRAGIETDM